MNGRKVQDVEAHRGYVREASLAIPQITMAPRLAGAGSGKQLIPRRVTRLLAVDNQAQFLAVPGGKSPIGISLNESRYLVSKRDLPAVLRVAVAAQHVSPIVKFGGVLMRRPRRRFLDQVCAYQALRADVLAGVDPFDQGTPPCSEPVDPAFHGILIPPKLGGRELATPSVIANRLHRLPSPSLFPYVSIQKLTDN